MVANVKRKHEDPTVYVPREDNPFRADQSYAVADVQRILSVGRTTVERMEADGRLPRGLRMPALGVRWPGHVLVRWWDRQAAEAEAKAAEQVAAQ